MLRPASRSEPNSTADSNASSVSGCGLDHVIPLFAIRVQTRLGKEIRRLHYGLDGIAEIVR